MKHWLRIRNIRKGEVSLEQDLLSVAWNIALTTQLSSVNNIISEGQNFDKNRWGLAKLQELVIILKLQNPQYYNYLIFRATRQRFKVDDIIGLHNHVDPLRCGASVVSICQQQRVVYVEICSFVEKHLPRQKYNQFGDILRVCWSYFGDISTRYFGAGKWVM